jgi:hypothetical protein
MLLYILHRTRLEGSREQWRMKIWDLEEMKGEVAMVLLATSCVKIMKLTTRDTRKWS